MDRQKNILTLSFTAFGLWSLLILSSHFYSSNEAYATGEIALVKEKEPQSQEIVKTAPLIAAEEISMLTTKEVLTPEGAADVKKQDIASQAESSSKQVLNKQSPRKPLDKKHLVAKGETLSTISQKYYGTSKKWPDIYEANRDHLKSSEKIKPGTEIVIP